MKKLILVRAGSSVWEEANCDNAVDGSKPSKDDQRLQGIVSLPLTESDKKGLRKVAAVLQREGVQVLYNSGNESAGPTAKYLSQLCHVKAKTVSGLSELNCGLWQGLQIKEIKNRFGSAYRQWRSDPVSVCPPQGECVAAAGERVIRALQKLGKKNKDKTVVVVAAPIVGALIECIMSAEGQHGILSGSGETITCDNGNWERLWYFVDLAEPLRIFESEGATASSQSGQQ